MNEENKLEQEQLQEEVAQPVQEEVKKTVATADNASADNATFDWDAFESDNEGDVDVEATKAAYENSLSHIADGEVIEGTVVAKNKREVVVNIGYKSEAVINAAEFKYCEDTLQVGDKVEVFV